MSEDQKTDTVRVFWGNCSLVVGHLPGRVNVAVYSISPGGDLDVLAYCVGQDASRRLATLVRSLGKTYDAMVGVAHITPKEAPDD